MKYKVEAYVTLGMGLIQHVLLLKMRLLYIDWLASGIYASVEMQSGFHTGFSCWG